jgi:hypothetical protein
MQGYRTIHRWPRIKKNKTKKKSARRRDESEGKGERASIVRERKPVVEKRVRGE